MIPEIKEDAYKRLESDILLNGYDVRFPIYLYEGDIIDGWGRYKICQKHKIVPVYENFEGTLLEAIQFILRTNKRRNLTSSQWAAIANEATDIINTLEREAKERQKLSEGRGKKGTVKIPEVNKGETSEKLAEIFPTNPTY